MFDFTIPKGLDYTFVIKVLQKNTQSPQSLVSLSSAKLIVFSKEDLKTVFNIDMVVSNAVNGVLKCTIPTAKTSLLKVFRGRKEENYYIKSGYQGNMNMIFSDNTLDINMLIKDIFVIPTGN